MDETSQIRCDTCSTFYRNLDGRQIDYPRQQQSTFVTSQIEEGRRALSEDKKKVQ